MIRINLLPYRNARRRQQIVQHLGIAFGAIALTGLIAMGLHWSASSQLADLQETYTELKAQNQMLQKKIGKIRNLEALRADVEKKLKLVDQLQEGRFRSLMTLHELARLIPENVWLTKIQDDGPLIKLKGLGESNKAIANFMRQLDASKLFSDVRLEVISRVNAGGVTVRSFSLTLARVDKSAGQPKTAGRAS